MDKTLCTAVQTDPSKLPSQSPAKSQETDLPKPLSKLPWNVPSKQGVPLQMLLPPAQETAAKSCQSSPGNRLPARSPISPQLQK